MITLLVSRKQTKGAFSMLTQTTLPGDGTPLHTHHREDEALYILEGEYEIQNGDKTVRARADLFPSPPLKEATLANHLPNSCPNLPQSCQRNETTTCLTHITIPAT
ncbi:MAG: cupin domain-containing protein [Syntrophobacteraceae bacterium]